MSEAVAPVEGAEKPAAPVDEAAAKAAELAKTVEAKGPKPPGENKLAYLARKEQERVRKEVALKQKEAELSERERRYAEQDQRRKGYAVNPVAALQDAFPGMTPQQAYEFLTNAILSEGKPTADGQVYQVRQELEELKRAQVEAQKRQSEEAQKAQEAARSQAVEDFRGEILDFVKANGETFELCAIYPEETQDLVYSLIETHYEQTGETMSVKEAAEKAETYWEGEAMKAAKTKRVQAKLQPQPEVPRTLSNDATASMPSVINSPKTEQERWQRAMAALDRSAGKPT